MKKTNIKQKVVAVAELKAQLSEYLRLVKNGREVVITERGRPIAMLSPLRGAHEVAARVAELVALGVARAPSRPLDPARLRRGRPTDMSGRSLQVLLEDRAEGR